ncbi:MAG: glycoside hydrolase family 99-like domain-containing protein [Bacteroidales bacterium]|nr:glycoside hydrolase family 99-like domain-containing protein [Bacteroidales bacterium]
MKNKVRTLAFYLPQFHPIPENDAWWGKGFTEWTNVARAKPVFPGHYQPHLPADLGFYDLRIPEVMVQQAKLASGYGIHGFCYYYYNFNGKKLLDLPLNEMLKSGKPDFPFCLCWANENWTRRWDGRDEEVLISQEHSLEGDKNFIKDILPFLKDKRYIRVNNKLLLLIYRVEKLDNPRNTAEAWREIVKKELGEELYLCSVNNFTKEIDPASFGFDATVQFPLDFNPACKYESSTIAKTHQLENNDVKDYWFYNYDCIVKTMLNVKNPGYKFFRGAFPSWDNTPRRKNTGAVFLNSSPGKYQNFLKRTIDLTLKEQAGDEQLVFINAWNEWAEGAHLEPDMKYGHAWLEATKDAIEGKEAEVPGPAEINLDVPNKEQENKVLVKETVNHASNTAIPEKRKAGEKPKVLIVSYNFPRHDNSSGELRFFSLVQMLTKYWDIDFGIIPTHLEVNSKPEMEKYAGQLQKLGINNLPLEKGGLANAIKNNAYDGAYFNFYWVAEQFITLFKKHQPLAFVVVDSVDVHFAREMSQAALKQSDIAQAIETKARELSVYRSADITIAVSNEDFELLHHKEKIKNVSIVPNIVPQFVRKKGQRKQVVNFIGNYAWPPNPDAVVWFVTEVWPLIYSQCPEAKFQIIGSEPTPEVLALASSPGVQVLGFVPETKPYLESAAVSVAPLRFGGGMKGKVNEAMAYGLPVVATSFGAQGFNAVHGKEMFIEDEARGFADAVVKLLKDELLQEEMGLAGQQLNADICSPEAIEKKIKTLVSLSRKISADKKRRAFWLKTKQWFKRLTESFHDVGLGFRLLFHGGIKKFLFRAYWYLKGKKKMEDIPVKIPKEKFTLTKINHVVRLPHNPVPIVSIIIPVYNQWDYTLQCLDSIQKNSGNIKYEVILMDDLSTDETRNAAGHVKNLRIIRNEKNLGFLLNCNKGASLAKGRYLVFLNNDTLVQPRWLFWMVRTMDYHHEVGLAGAKLIFSTGQLQEAGGIVFKDGSAMNYGREDKPGLPQYNYFKDVDYCSGAGICVRKEVWDQLGGFDTQFSPAYYEDTDLAFRIREMGYRTIFQPRSIIIHFEGISHGTDLSSGIKKKQVEHHKVFFKKWETELSYNNFYRDENLFLARERSKFKTIILFVDHRVPEYQNSENNELFSLVKNDLNRVKLFPGDFIRREPDTGRWEQDGVEVLYGDWYSKNWKQWITENTSNISKLYFSNVEVAEKWLPQLKAVFGGAAPEIEVVSFK